MPGDANCKTMRFMAWTANTAIGADPVQVMEVLTRPCAIAAWAPIPFEVEGLKSRRLETGSKARVAGMLAGKELAFDVEVHEASADALRLTAAGPFVEMDVAYDVRALDEWSQVQASIEVTGKGVMGRFVAKAVEGFLAGGALNSALSQLALAAENHELTLAGLAA
jgi:primosomal replication protein N